VYAKVVRVPLHDSAYRVDLLQRRRDGRTALKRARHIDGPELSAHATAPQPRDVRVQAGRGLVDADVQRVEVVANPGA